MAIDVDTEHSVVLYGIEWEQCQRIVDALGEYHARHNYDGNRLELQRILVGLRWQDYSTFLEALGDFKLSHTFDGWTLEMMSPGKDHEWIAHLLGRFIEQMTIQLSIPIQGVGSMTVANPNVGRSIQPDQSYYVTNEPAVSRKLKFDPAIDPPPDLIIEVDKTNSSVPRMPTFAALGIPEVWRHDHEGLHFFRLNATGSYERIDRSGEFPWLSSRDLFNFLSRHGRTKENDLILEFATFATAEHSVWKRSVGSSN